MRSTPIDDRTTRARIRDAAMEEFASGGIAATSLRSIATAAGVAPSHISHYFGSKDGLRRACDEHLLTLFQQAEQQLGPAGREVDPIALIASFGDGQVALRYLARALIEPDDRTELVDRVMTASLDYIAALGGKGWMTRGSRDRDILLSLFSLAITAIGPAAKRWLGADLVADALDLPAQKRFIAAYVELFGAASLTEEGRRAMSSLASEAAASAASSLAEARGPDPGDDADARPEPRRRTACPTEGAP